MKKIGLYILVSLSVLRVSAQDKRVILCEGDTAYLKANSIDAVSYQWFRNNQRLQNETSNILMVITSGVYYSKGVSSEGCVSDSSVNINVEQKLPIAKNDTCLLQPDREINIAVLQNDTPGCVDFQFARLSIITPPLHGDLSINSDNSIKYRARPYVSEEDEFSYQITDRKGFSSNIALVYILINPDCAAVFPNPVDKQLTVIINNRFITQLKLMDDKGRTLYHVSILNRPEMKIDMIPFAQGIYFIQLLDAENNLYCVFKIFKKGE